MPMKNFEKKWRLCAARARQAPARSESPPPGFVTRVLWQPSPAMETSLEALWEQLAMRWLGAVAGVLVVCAALELPNLRPDPVLKPGIEDTITQLVWKL